MCFVVASVSNSGVFILSIFLVVVMLRKLYCAGEWTGVPVSARQSLQSSHLSPYPSLSVVLEFLVCLWVKQRTLRVHWLSAQELGDPMHC